MFVMCGIHSACITCTKHCVHLPNYLCVPNTVLEPLKLVISHSLLVRYELVLGSFEVRYQFVMPNLDGHIR